MSAFRNLRYLSPACFLLCGSLLSNRAAAQDEFKADRLIAPVVGKSLGPDSLDSKTLIHAWTEFSPHARHTATVAFTMGSSSSYIVALDGKPGKPYGEIRVYPRFSPDGHRLACVAQTDGEYWSRVLEP